MKLNLSRKIAAGPALLFVLLQLESYTLYIHRSGDGVLPLLGFWLRVPFLQLENLAYSALLLGLMYLAGGRRKSRTPAAAYTGLGLALASSVYLICDQLGYRLFFDHLRLSAADVRVANFRVFIDSIRSEAPRMLWLNLALCALWLAYTFRAIRQEMKAHPLPLPAPRPPSRARRGALLAYLLISAGTVFTTSNENLDHHPVFVLLRDLPRRFRQERSTGQLDRGVFTLRHGQENGTPPAFPKIPPLPPGKPLNVILWVMESVGAPQLLEPGGLPFTELAPRLRQAASHALIFDHAYTTCPATMRSHAAVLTGGRTLTWGNIRREFSAHYGGPTFVSELKKQGYATALFSAQDLDTGNLDGFYGPLGFDRLFDFGKQPAAFRDAHYFNSWGGDDDLIRDLALEWIDRGNRSQPFFLQLVPVSAHHPYTVPEELRLPGKDPTNLEKYRNAIRYTDRSLGKLLDALQARGLADSTVILVTGDHGEAFGDIHRKNLIHREYLYEENIRTFFMLIDPRLPAVPVISHRVVSTGDILPTALNWLGTAPGKTYDVLGQDLTRPDYQPRIVFFQKNNDPDLIGLRDGKWKFIVTKFGGAVPELYDLEADPREQRNLASLHPDMWKEYRDLCAKWYVGMNNDYINHLVDFTNEFRM